MSKPLCTVDLSELNAFERTEVVGKLMADNTFENVSLVQKKFKGVRLEFKGNAFEIFNARNPCIFGDEMRCEAAAMEHVLTYLVYRAKKQKNIEAENVVRILGTLQDDMFRPKRKTLTIIPKRDPATRWRDPSSPSWTVPEWC